MTQILTLWQIIELNMVTPHPLPFFDSTLTVHIRKIDDTTSMQLVMAQCEHLLLSEINIKNILSSDEQRVLASRQKCHAKKEYLASRFLIKKLIRQYYDHPFSQLNTVFNQTTKRLEVFYKQQCLPFSVVISHSHQGVLVCLQKGRKSIGVDLEYLNPKRRIAKLAAHFYHPNEVNLINHTTLSVNRFYRIWTLKEALAKATKQPIARLLSQDVFATLSAHQLNALSTHTHHYDISLVSEDDEPITLYVIDLLPTLV